MVELEFGLLVSVEEGINGRTLEKNPRNKARTIYKPSPHMTNPGPWWEASALTTTPSLLLQEMVTLGFFLWYEKTQINKWNRAFQK